MRTIGAMDGLDVDAQGDPVFAGAVLALVQELTRIGLYSGGNHR